MIPLSQFVYQRRGIGRYSNGEIISPLETNDLAKEIGLGERSTQYRLQIANDITDDVKEIIRDTPTADSIKRIGLINPITVRNDDSKYILVSGVHRLEAYKLLEKTEIEATVFYGDDKDVELAEIDENLIRHDLSILDQSDHLYRRNEILEELGERAESGDNRFTDRGVTVTPLLTPGRLEVVTQCHHLPQCAIRHIYSRFLAEAQNSAKLPLTKPPICGIITPEYRSGHDGREHEFP